MNEEELKTNLWDKFWETSRDAEDGTRLRDWDKSVISKVSFFEGFQKGKLEERERIEDLIIDMRFKIQNKLNNYFNIDTRTLLFIYNKELSQLQKEIGEEN